MIFCLRVASVIAGSLLLAACAGPPEIAPRTDIKRAAIVSLLGERPEHVQVGEGAYPTLQEVDPPQDWTIDDYVGSLVGTRLAARAGAEPIAASAQDRAAFAKLAEFRPANDADLLDLTAVKAAIGAYAAREKLEWIVFVTPARLATSDVGTLRVYGGYGKYGRGLTTGCYASIRVTVVDARTATVLKQGMAARVVRGQVAAVRGKRLRELSDTLRDDMRECMQNALDEVQYAAIDKMGY